MLRMHTQMNLDVALCPKNAQYIVKSRRETEYGDEYMSIDLVDETKQAAAYDKIILCIWLLSHKLPASYDESIPSIPTEKFPRSLSQITNTVVSVERNCRR